MDASLPLSILYEDNHIIVCIKPAGVLSQPSHPEDLDMMTMLKDYLKEKYQKPGNVFLGLVHRLDRNVGGVMVYAKTSKAASRLSESMRNHEFEKHYFAVIHAQLPIGKSDSFVDYLSKDEDEVKAIHATASTGKEARLRYVVKSVADHNTKPLTLVDIELETGRFHQIRYQFASRGMPIYGDEKYGASRIRDSHFIGLFAYQLSFPHPTTKENMVFTATPSEGIFTLFFKYV